MGKEGSLKELANVRRMGKWDMLEANKKEIEEDLAEITRKEQQLWLDNRGYEEYTYGERYSRRCETFLERYRNDPELNREGEIIETGQENKNTKTRRRCRNVILKAIQADGKVLDEEQSISLTVVGRV